MQKTMNEEKLTRVLNQLAFISLLMDVIDIELHHDLIGEKFTQPLLNNHVRRIKESATAIKTSISRHLKVINKEEALYEFATQYHQLIKFFKDKDAETLEELVINLEAYEKKKQQELQLYS